MWSRCTATLRQLERIRLRLTLSRGDYIFRRIQGSAYYGATSLIWEIPRYEAPTQDTDDH